MDYKSFIREVPDFPKPGILFYDITTLLKEPNCLRSIIDEFVKTYKGAGISKVVGIESRGFILGSPVAYHLNAGFVPVRKPGKLPADVFEVKYDLEYGSNALSIHRDAIHEGESVLILDDLLATGGTVAATVELICQVGGKVSGIGFLVELLALEGRKKIANHAIHSLVRYE